MIEYSMGNDPIQSLIKETSSGVFYALHEDREFNSVFQPIYDINNHIIGYESLIRIKCIENNIQPQLFFDEIEADLEKDLFYFLLTAKLHLQNFSLFNNGCFLSINASPNVFNFLSANDDAIALLLKRLNELKIDPKQIIYEITEKENGNLNATLLGRDNLRTKKIKIAVDDYGSGFFNLDIVKEIKPNVIKIDRSIVRDVLNKSGVKDIIEVKELKEYFPFKIVAEGIETEDEMNILKQIGIDYFQGFLLSKPILTIDILQNNHVPTEA